MKDTNLLIGSLSNDLFRVATLSQRGSIEGAATFLVEAKRWTNQLGKMKMPEHIEYIVKEVEKIELGPISPAFAEKLLMYGVLLQNYSLHM